MSYDCGHQGSYGGRTCNHLLEKQAEGVVRYFTGHGREYYLVCHQCAKLGLEALTLSAVCDECFSQLNDEGDWELTVGRPQVFERVTDFTFVHKEIYFQALAEQKILATYPVEQSGASRWIVLLEGGDVIELNVTEQSIRSLLRITNLELSDKVSMICSPKLEFFAVANTFGSEAIVIDAQSGRTTMRLNRGKYHIEHSKFPMAFFKRDDELYLVHATDWNRLDISNPLTSERLTERILTDERDEQGYYPHNLDYFHGRLVVSPDNQWIAEYGWVWSPVGVVRCWNLKQWLQNNIWESESGETVKNISQCGYCWERAMCWLDDRRLVVWGYGNDDDYIFAGVRIWDVTTGKEVFWFAGPEDGQLVFDQYLFSISQNGTDVWDVNTGERLLHDPAFHPINYHHGLKQFLSILPNGIFQLSRLSTSEVE